MRGAEPASRAVLCDLIAARQVDLVSFVLRTNILAADSVPGWLERVDDRLARLEILAQS